MLIFLGCWPLLFGLSYELALHNNQHPSLRRAFQLASVGWGALLVLLTEGLSLFKSLNRAGLVVGWLVLLCLLAGIYSYLLWRRTGGHFSLPSLRANFKFVGWLPALMLALIVFQVMALALLALLYPPDNVDAMSYHLARVMHWQQNQSVATYPTNIERQVQLNPFAEFVLLHLQILTGGDHFANLVQWFALLLSVVGISEIARKLGADHNTQLVAALLCVSIPLGILEASSPQNDYVVTAGLVCFVSFGLSLVEQPEQLVWAIGAGLALGLALLTKSDAYFYAAPFCGIFGLVYLLKQRSKILKPLLVIILLALLLNAGYLTRNLSLYGSISGPTGNYVNSLFTPAALLSNVIRNTAAQLPAGEQGDLVAPVSRLALKGLSQLHNLTGLSPTDQRTTGDTANAFLVAPNYNENYSGNPLHALLIILALGAVLIRRTTSVIRLYVLALILGFLSLSYYFLWWGGSSSRLQLPLVVLWCAPLALLLFPNGINKWWLCLPLLVALYSLNWTFKSDSHSLLNLPQTLAQPRSAQYPTFPLPTQDFQKMIDLIAASGCNRVGLSVGENTAEYPVWVLLQERDFRGEIEHINVQNATRRYSSSDFRPCAVIAETHPAPLRSSQCQLTGSQNCEAPLRGGLEDYQSRFVSYSFPASFYLYLDPQFAGNG